MSWLRFDALYPARHAQWKRLPVLMHEVVMSQWFSPERGLQVPHLGGGLGLGVALTTEAVASRRVLRRVRVFMVVYDWGS